MTVSILVRSDDYDVRQIPSADRTPDWLKQAASDLDPAAREWTNPFLAGEDGIREKMRKAELLVVVESRRSGHIAGFLSAMTPRVLARTQLDVCYIQGVVCHPNLGGKRKYTRMLDACGARCRLELLHTRSPLMKRSLELRNEAFFPDGRVMCEELELDVRAFLDEIERPQPFSPVTGLVRGIYPAGLYASSFAGPRDHTFDCLTSPKDALLVAGFASEADAAFWTITERRHAAR